MLIVCCIFQTAPFSRSGIDKIKAHWKLATGTANFIAVELCTS